MSVQAEAKALARRAVDMYCEGSVDADDAERDRLAGCLAIVVIDGRKRIAELEETAKARARLLADATRERQSQAKRIAELENQNEGLVERVNHYKIVLADSINVEMDRDEHKAAREKAEERLGLAIQMADQMGLPKDLVLAERIRRGVQSLTKSRDANLSEATEQFSARKRAEDSCDQGVKERDDLRARITELEAELALPPIEPPYKTDRVGVCWWCGKAVRPGCCDGPPKTLLEFLRLENKRHKAAREKAEAALRSLVSGAAGAAEEARSALGITSDSSKGPEAARRFTFKIKDSAALDGSSK